MLRAFLFVTLLALAGSTSAQQATDWLWQFEDTAEERALESNEVPDETLRRGATEIRNLMQGEGEGEADEHEDPPGSNEALYKALRLLNPNTLNTTIYWHCISTSYVYLSEYGIFQKGDDKYQQCEAEGHFLFERSCLHNMLVPSNCVDGTWDCGPEWVNNVAMAVTYIHNEVKRWPQCFAAYGNIESKTLTWDCEEHCDLPCSYPEKFCTTIEKSYNSSVCTLDCPHRGNRRLRQDNVHDMTLTIGDAHLVDMSSPSPPTPSPSTPDVSQPTPTPMPPAPTPASPTSSPSVPTPASSPPTSAVPTDDGITLMFSFAIQSSRAISELESDQHFIGEMKKVGLKILGLSDDKIGWITMALTQAAARRLRLHVERRLTASISVEYSAKIPNAAVDDVSIVPDPTAIEEEVRNAVQNAEKASGVSYGVTVDSASITTMTSDLGSNWAAAVDAEQGSTSTTLKKKENHGLVSAADRKKTATWTILVVQLAMMCFALIAH